jgi:hypothetical protein
VLPSFAIFVGLLIDHHVRRIAWQQIARDRRRNWEEWRLLKTAGDLDGCPNCGFMSHKAEGIAENKQGERT